MDEEDFAYDPDMPEQDDSFSDEMENGDSYVPPDIDDDGYTDDRDDSQFENIPENWAEGYDDLNGAPEGEGDF